MLRFIVWVELHFLFAHRIFADTAQKSGREGGRGSEHIVFELCKAAEEESVIN